LPHKRRHEARRSHGNALKPVRDSESGRQLRQLFSVAVALCVFGITVIVSMFTGSPFWTATLPIGVALGGVLGLISWLLVSSISNGLSRLLQLHGSGTKSRDYSEQKALVARGEFAAAADSYRSHMIAFPNDNDARLQLADLLYSSLQVPEDALELYLSVRESNPSRGQQRQVVDALINIYRLVGNESGLRRELAGAARDFPDTVLGAGARRELQRRVSQ
jgi:hypothetical protein